MQRIVLNHLAELEESKGKGKEKEELGRGADAAKQPAASNHPNNASAPDKGDSGL